MRAGIWIFLISAIHSTALAGFPEGKAALARKDLPTAFQEFLAAANLGDPRAQHAVALLYAGGIGTQPSDVDAVKWFRAAADQNHVHSQFNLGVMYHTGRGLARSRQEAALWYRKAATAGHAQAQNDLGVMLLTGDGANYDYRASLDSLRKAAESGNPIARFNLGCAYLVGGSTAYVGAQVGAGPRMGVSGDLFPPDPQQAVKWFRVAADQGHVVAQYNLGFLYDRALGVPKDHKEAANWYGRAIDSGFPPAFRGLAQLLETSVEIAKDPSAASGLRQSFLKARYRTQEHPYVVLQFGIEADLNPTASLAPGTPGPRDGYSSLHTPGFSIDPELDPQANEPRVSPRIIRDPNEYIPAVLQRVMRFVIRPEGAPATATAVVELGITSRGEVANGAVRESSGDAGYDAAVAAAVMRAQPLPIMEAWARSGQIHTLTLKIRVQK